MITADEKNCKIGFYQLYGACTLKGGHFIVATE